MIRLRQPQIILRNCPIKAKFQTKNNMSEQKRKQPIDKVKIEVDVISEKENNENLAISKRRKHIKIDFEKELVKKESKKEANVPSIEDIHGLLTTLHGKPARHPRETNSVNACNWKKDVLLACVSVILSQNTSDKNSSRALASLLAKFPEGLDQMRLAPVEQIEEAIRSGGLSKIKSKRIHELLNQVHQDFGKTSLEHLRDKTTEEVKECLSAYKGLGPKTISCVLLFSMHRDDFPVDTHVHRLCQRLGWVSTKTNREQTYLEMNARIKDEMKFDMHVLLIRHGRNVCDKRNPKCGSCPVNHLCPSAGKSFKKKKAEDED